jgi:predicted regulator of Ras-like GTPase activity (Roadblock/LC7/MglB family)
MYFAPEYFKDKVVEIPIYGLYIGEIGLALLLSLICYENANSTQLLQITSIIIGFTMLYGATGNVLHNRTQFLPDNWLLISWVELILMNLFGLISTMSLFRLAPEESPYNTQAAPKAETVSQQQPTIDQAQISAQRQSVQNAQAIPLAPSQPSTATGKPKESLDFSPPETAQPTVDPAAAGHESGRQESVKDILESLSISRITRLEERINRKKVSSLEDLFKEENKAAAAARSQDEEEEETPSLEITGVISTDHVDDIKAVIEASPAMAPIETPSVTPEEITKDIEDTHVRSLDDLEPLTEVEKQKNRGLFRKDVEEDINGVFTNLFVEGADKDFSQEALAQVKSTPDISAEPAPEPVIEATPAPVEEPTPIPAVEPTPAPVVEATPAPVAEPASTPVVEEPAPAPVAEPTPTPVVEAIPAQVVEATPSPVAEPASSPAASLPSEAPQQPTPQPAAASTTPAEPIKPLVESKEIKEFGKLAASATQSQESSALGGTIKTLGKMLVDSMAIEKIIKSSTTKKPGGGGPRIISEIQGEALQSFLKKIDETDSVVAGSLIMGLDGIPIVSTIEAPLNKDVLGPLSLAMFNSANLTTQQLEIGDFRQLVLYTNENAIVLTDFSAGVLAVFVEKYDVNKIELVVNNINTIMNG